MALTVGELVANIDADDSGMQRGLDSAELRLRGFQQDAEGRLRRLDGTFASVGERIAMGFAEAEQSSNRFGLSLGRLSALGGMAGGLGGIAATIGKLGAGIGTAVPLVAGLATTVAQIAPAAGVAVTGLIAVQLASKALKLGMVGVKDAVSAALDPSNPQAYAEALKKLSPSARSFVGEIRTLQPQLKALQQGVQERLFQGLDGILREMGKTTLPILKNGLTNAAGALNLMGKNIGNTAIGMSKSGVLGQAISGANVGLSNLARVPSQLMLGLTQIGAAAAPAFGRLTAAAGAGADDLSDAFTRAFEDGSVEAAIDQAIGLIKQLGSIIGNVGSIIGSVFGAAQASGGGFLGTLQEITGALKTAFASPAVQEALGAIFDTMATLAKTVGPLLTQALGALAPIFTALGPPIQRIIAMLGPALSGIIAALGPVLAVAATAVGALLDAVAPLLPVVGALVESLLPALTPLLGLVAGVFTALAPMVAQFANILMSVLTPVLDALVPAIQPIVDALLVLVQAVFPILSAQATAFAPLIATLAETFATLLVALGPVIAQLILLAADVLTKMTPILTMVIGFVAKLAAVFGGELARVVTGVVVPAFEMIAALLAGDFSGAWQAAKTMVSGIIDAWIRIFRELPAKAAEALSGLAGALWSRIQEAGGRFNEGVRQKRDEAIAKLRELPSLARNALGDLGSVLWNAGSRLIQGLIDGVSAKIGALRSKLGSVTDMIPDWKGPAERDASLLRPAGRLLMDGLMGGVDDRVPALQAQLGGLTGALPGMLGPMGAGGGAAVSVRVTLDGPESMTKLIREITANVGRGDVQTAFGSF